MIRRERVTYLLTYSRTYLDDIFLYRLGIYFILFHETTISLHDVRHYENLPAATNHYHAAIIKAILLHRSSLSAPSGVVY